MLKIKGKFNRRGTVAYSISRAGYFLYCFRNGEFMGEESLSHLACYAVPY